MMDARRAPPIVWSAHGIVAKTRPTAVARLGPLGEPRSEHAVPPGTLAIGLGAEGLVTTDGFVVRHEDGRETRMIEAMNPWRERRVIARCAFSEDARTVAITWQRADGEWLAYDGFGVFDTTTGAPKAPTPTPTLPDDWCDGEVAFAGGFGLFAYRTTWIGTVWGSQGGPGRGFVVWDVDSREQVASDSDDGGGDFRDVEPLVVALDRAAAFVARGRAGSISRFEVTSDLELDLGVGPSIVSPGAIAVTRQGTLVIACAAGVLVWPSFEEQFTVEADDPLGVALSPDETQVAWLERSGRVRTARLARSTG